MLRTITNRRSPLIKAKEGSHEEKISYQAEKENAA